MPVRFIQRWLSIILCTPGYYVLEYAKEDKLFVPVGLERKLSRYVGFQDPTIARLGSSLWQRTKSNIKESVEKLAKELLNLYALKEGAERTVYIEDKELESQFKSGFIFQETPDQAQAIEGIKEDLSKTKPMDRIVCGDVGFGKTEVAMRKKLFWLRQITGRLLSYAPLQF
jgi:transcription-repair coupling factor (superfamily II helicase)